MRIKDIWRARSATPTRAAVWFLAISTATAACDSPMAPLQGAALIKVSGDEQEGRPGDQLKPIIVILRDASGKPVPGARVRFSVSAGDGFVTLILVDAGGREFLARHAGPADQITNGNGEALALWSLGRHGENTLLATVQREGTPLQVTFRATSLSSGYAGGSFSLTSTGTSVKLMNRYRCYVNSGSLVLSADGSFKGQSHIACDDGGFAVDLFDLIETGFYAVSGSAIVLHYQTSNDTYSFPQRVITGTLSEGTIVYTSHDAEWRYASLD